MAENKKQYELTIAIAGKIEASFGSALNNANEQLALLEKSSRGATKAARSAVKSTNKEIAPFEKFTGNVTKETLTGIKAIDDAAEKAAARGIKIGKNFKNVLGHVSVSFGKFVGGVAKATMSGMQATGNVAVKAAMAGINVGREFESAMSQVSATMLLDTSEEGKAAFEILENAARECGASTAFSATEAAEGLNYLALAGYDAEKAAAALPTVLKLAGAGAMDLGSASDMVTDAMSALGKEATQDNLTTFADQLAKAASKSNTSVAQLGEAIVTVGGTAQGLAGDTVELNTALGILADSGIKGAEGGTHLRNLIMSLQNPRNKEAAELFNQLGLQAYDAEGNMRSLGDVFGDLNAQLAGASAADVNSTLATIFKQTDLASARAMMAATADSVESVGTALDAALADSGTSMAKLGIDIQTMSETFDTAMTQEQFAKDMLEQFGITSEQAGILFSGLQSVVGGTGNRFEELSSAIEDSKDACDDMYALQLDNLNGDIAILQSSLSDLGISFYKDVGGPAREMTQLASKMVGELNSAYKDGGISAMIAEVGNCLSEMVDAIADYAPEIAGIGVELMINFINGIMNNSGSIASAAGDVLAILVDGLYEFLPLLYTAGIDIITQLASSVIEHAPQLINGGTQAIVNFINGIIQRLPTVIDTALTLVQTLVDSIGSNAQMLINAAIQLVGNLILGIVQMLPQLLQSGVQLILNLVQGILANLPFILQVAVQVVTNFTSGIVSMIPVIIQSGIQLIISLIQGIIANLGNIVQAAGEIIGALAGGLIQSIPQIFTAGAQLLGALIEMIFTTDWLQVGIDIIKGIIKGLMSAGKSVWEAIKSLFTGKEAEIEIPDSGATAAQSYAAGIESNAYVVGNAMESFSATALGSMDSSWQTVNTNAQTAMQDLSTTVTTEAESAAYAVKSAFEDMTITIPKPKIPNISVSTDSIGYGESGSVDVPRFSVNWNASGGIFNKPTVFGTTSGFQGVGEAGAEAIIPLDMLWNNLNNMISGGMQRLVNEMVSADKLSGIGAGRRIGSAVSESYRGMTSNAINKMTETDRTDNSSRVIYSPQITIQGNADRGDIESALRMSQQEFDRMYAEHERQRLRTSFAT